jgi:hypothetical protein
VAAQNSERFRSRDSAIGLLPFRLKAARSAGQTEQIARPQIVGVASPSMKASRPHSHSPFVRSH